MLKLYFYLSKSRMAEIVILKCNVEESIEGRNDKIFSRDTLIDFEIDIKVSNNTIDCESGLHQGCTTHMVDLHGYDFITLNVKYMDYYEELFLDSYINKCYKKY